MGDMMDKVPDHYRNSIESGVQVCIDTWREKMDDLPEGYRFCIIGRFDIPETANPDNYLPELSPFFDDVEKTGKYRAMYFRPNSPIALDRRTSKVGEIPMLGVDAALLGLSNPELKLLPAPLRLQDEHCEEAYLMGRGISGPAVATVGTGTSKTLAIGALRRAENATSL